MMRNYIIKISSEIVVKALRGTIRKEEVKFSDNIGILSQYINDH